MSSRREFITLLGGAAAAWPVSARAQQPRAHAANWRVHAWTPDDAEYQARNAAFLLRAGALGWDISRNLRIDYRWAPGRYRTLSHDTRRNSSRWRRTSFWRPAPPPLARC